ncbi:MAG TPA: haloacid dehalogenase [Myxococcales bacterium]|nr:haloacid dehalogenase [Myxococcales bacterium]HAN32010.1 haloacid dehalogenase [Myxococcales bacterium]
MKKRLSWQAMLDLYDIFLFDAYGVLVHGSGPIDGAAQVLTKLNEAGRPWKVVTNDASKRPDIAAAKYRRWGLPVDSEQIVSSGSLLPAWIVGQGLDGQRAALLGPSGCEDWLMEAGCEVVPVVSDTWDFLVICDESGFDFLAGMDAALSEIFARVDVGRPVDVVVPNPDLIYTQAPGRFGFAAGTMAEMLRQALTLRYAEHQCRFHFLGKPYVPIFDRALSDQGAKRPLMFGDQLQTDILGAHRAGIDSVWVGSGVLSDLDRLMGEKVQPTWWLPSLAGL